MFYLAESQVRLLLCRPDYQSAVSQGKFFHWHCGCSATHQAGALMAIEACRYHGALLAAVTPLSDERGSGMGYRFVPATRRWRGASD